MNGIASVGQNKMGYLIKLIKKATSSNFISIWKNDGKRPFSCVWDTDSLDFELEELRKIISLGCVAFISIGSRADDLHDTIDSIVDTITIDFDTTFRVDTRGSAISNDSINDAINELENDLFEEDEGTFSTIYVFSKNYIAL